VARLGHPRGSDGTDPAQHQDVLGCHMQLLGVDTECEVLGSFEDDRTSSVLHQLRIRRCLLDDRTVGGEVAAKYRNASHGVDGGGVCSDHLLREGLRGSVQFLTESTAGDGELLRVEQSPKFRQQSWHSADRKSTRLNSSHVSISYA